MSDTETIEEETQGSGLRSRMYLHEGFVQWYLDEYDIDLEEASAAEVIAHFAARRNEFRKSEFYVNMIAEHVEAQEAEKAERAQAREAAKAERAAAKAAEKEAKAAAKAAKDAEESEAAPKATKATKAKKAGKAKKASSGDADPFA